MKFHMLSGAIVALMAFAVSAHDAGAAVTVLGNGLPASCFQIAEFGGDAEEGIQTCTTALESAAMSTTDRAATYVNRGILKSRRDDLQGAMTDYEAGMKLNAKMGEAYVNRGATLISLRRYQEALSDISRGIALGSKKPEIAYYDRAIAREALGDIRGAYEDFKKALEIQPDFERASLQLQRFHVVRSGEQGGA
jgi:tetratricopeptide (TPR) repeat protein